jgi:septum formation protein
MNYRIVLASNSPRRKEMLSKFLNEFEVIASEYEENIDNCGNPKIEVMKAALLKGMNVVDKVNKPSIIIAADTIVYYENILEKPKSEEEAKIMLKTLSNKWHDVYTGFAIIDSTTNKSIINFEKTRVKFNNLSSELIDWYVATKEPMDKAGAYGIQDLGALLVEKIEGDYFNVVGFPISKIHEMLCSHFNYKFF